MTTPETELARAINHAMAEVARLGDPEKLPLPVRTVLLVHAAQGIIDNGGFQYLFEADFPNKPPYSMFVDAYRAIGADAETNALSAAVALFPFADSHEHKDRRNKFMDQFQDEDGDVVHSPFEPYTRKLCGNKAVWRLLADYVLAHRGLF